MHAIHVFISDLDMHIGVVQAAIREKAKKIGLEVFYRGDGRIRNMSSVAVLPECPTTGVSGCIKGIT